MKYCYMIVWTSKGKGYACFSVQEKMNDWVLGAAFCSPKDRFNKKIARKIAEGRGGDTCVSKDHLPEKSRIQDIILLGLPSLNTPAWFKKALGRGHISWTLHRDYLKTNL